MCFLSYIDYQLDISLVWYTIFSQRTICDCECLVSHKQTQYSVYLAKGCWACLDTSDDYDGRGSKLLNFCSPYPL